MRDFRDAKSMAHALRDALKAKAVETTHSESLELIAKAFGYDNWNILCAKIDAAKPRLTAESAHSPAQEQEAARQKTLYCSFCDKSQFDVRRLIAGPSAYICDQCVELCVDFVEEAKDENLFRLMQGDEDSARIMSEEELAHYVERSRKGVERNRINLDAIARRLAMREGEIPRPDDPLASPRFNYLKNKEPDELLALQQAAQREQKRYEDALRIATAALGARRH
jgi:hypothetical protein